jgi:glycosyltransferase involved in cell wall biosynthesis
MKISIAMATYNGEEYIIDQLKSIENQDCSVYEIVICDDGSTDKTIELIQDFSQNTSLNIRLIKNKTNLGFAKNFAKAITLCDGDWIALCDHDDVWFSNKLSTIKRELQHKPDTPILVHDYILTNSKLEKKPFTKFERLEAAGSLPDTMISGCATIFRNSYPKLILPIPEGIAHDSWIHKVFDYILPSKMIIKEPLMYYRRHDKNASNSYISGDRLKSKLGYLLHYRTKKPLPGYSKGLNYLELIHERLRQDKKLNVDFFKLEKNIDLIKKRINILLCNFPKRQILAFRFLWCGGYDYFNGLISFFNDFLKVTRDEA